ncbi:hypothetical protein OGAPHI_004252 [Ogataea philodendri]|uniref:Bud emergence protein 1 n=1 Tax=Ogataea philodendri TaxID=1378263 RepID=A0A9P8T4L1_9ASCO|nr:uncharacterized protein OGAPHI_004252 [Ogataea philodendri]KAH3666063.1 hypothetical protein OGAPHI_004252 [Ogataea philodendri]
MSSFFKRSSRDKDRKDKTPTGRVSSTSSTISVGGGSNSSRQGSISAPTKVIQALRTYIAQQPGELSFKTGEFFYVTQQVTSNDPWVTAHDPVRNIQGRVPASYFKFFDKTHKPSAESPTSLASGSPKVGNSYSPTMSANKRVAPQPSLYGRLLYDFKAERQDELDVSAGDSIIICAHHEYEWFIGKFFDKIGEPGLVPVSYVQLFDITSKVPYSGSSKEIIDREKIPTIEEWKAIKNRHKASARTVGVAAHKESLSRSSSSGKFRAQETSSVYTVDVNIESFSCTNGKYWYLVRVLFNNGITRSLCRYYEDFFNFHQNVLSTWPKEGGKFDNKDKKERIIPFIPGPLMEVSESLCHKRLVDLDLYLKGLIQLPDYISRSTLVNSFFDIFEGDQEFTSLDAVQKIPIQPLRNPPNMVILNKSESPDTHHHHSTRNSQYQQDRLSHYERTNSINNRSNSVHMQSQPRSQSLVSSSSSSARIPSNSTANGIHHPSNGTSITPIEPNSESVSKIKLKFYYKDDIFAIVVPENIPLSNLKKLIVPRIDEFNDPAVDQKLKVIPKTSQNLSHSSYEPGSEISSDAALWTSESFCDKGKFLVVI